MGQSELESERVRHLCATTLQSDKREKKRQLLQAPSVGLWGNCKVNLVLRLHFAMRLTVRTEKVFFLLVQRA